MEAQHELHAIPSAKHKMCTNQHLVIADTRPRVRRHDVHGPIANFNAMPCSVWTHLKICSQILKECGVESGVREPLPRATAEGMGQYVRDISIARAFILLTSPRSSSDLISVSLS